jgi:hypothetical protein
MATAAVAIHPLNEAHVLGVFPSSFPTYWPTDVTCACSEPSENWDDDFEFGQDNQSGGNGRPRTSSTSSNGKSRTDQPRTRPRPPSNDTQHHPPSNTGTRTVSMTSSTMEDWDLPDTNPPVNLTAIVPETATTENWDDDFTVETRKNPPQKADLSGPRRSDVREESWDEDLELEGKRGQMGPGDDDDEFERFPASTGPLLLGRGVGRFLDLPLQVLCHLHPCRCSPINICRPSLFLDVPLHPAYFLCQIPFAHILPLPL